MMSGVQFSLAAVVAILVLASLVAGNECDCHVCGTVTASIDSNLVSGGAAVGGANLFSGTGIIDGQDFLVSDVSWLEGGRSTLTVGAAFYVNGLDLSSDHFQGGDLPNPITGISIPPAVQTEIDNGCFCPHAGMAQFLGTQTLGGQSFIWVVNNSSSLDFACGAGTTESTFSVSATGGLGTWISTASGFSSQTGFGTATASPSTSFPISLDSALFGGVCSQCPTPEPTGAPSESPSASPTKAPSESPTPFPTGTPTASPTGLPTAAPQEGSNPSFFEVQENVYIVAGAGGGLMLLLLLLVLVRSRRKTKSGNVVLSALPADVEDPETKPRKARGNAPDPSKSQSIRLEVDDEIFDWEKHIDKSSGEVYFFNPKTGESRWEPPTIKKKT